jgi:mono/diheme cytochrome c family protein
MNGYKVQTILLMPLVFFVSVSHARTQSEAEKTFKARCVVCHATDGSGSEAGKKLNTHDFHSSQVQSESDDELTEIIAKGKNKMPGYEKSLKSDEIKGLVAYFRELGMK